MDKFLYVDFIEIYENNETIKLIGEIDTKFLKQNRIETLYYSFPLIERMVLEIYKLVPEADIEHYEQGIMRTIMAMIENNKQLDVLPEYIIEIIEKYFGEDGIRNKLFHIKEESLTIEVNFKEINFLIMKLLVILKKKINDYTSFDFNKIEPIKGEN